MDMDIDSISSVSSLQSLAKLLSDAQEEDDDDGVSLPQEMTLLLHVVPQSHLVN